MGVKGTPNAKNGKSREIFGQGDKTDILIAHPPHFLKQKKMALFGGRGGEMYPSF